MKFHRLTRVIAFSFAAWFTCETFAADTAAPAPAAAVAPAPVASHTLSLEVAVVRFKPNSADRILRGFKDLNGDLRNVVEILKPDGAVSILYSGNREILLDEKTKAKFDALETRPVVLVGKPGAPVPPVTSYGLTLEVASHALEADRVALTWTGSMTWSPEIVDSWKGEKFLNFLGSAANMAKQATAATGGADNKGVDSGLDIGLSFAQLFNPKGAPTDSQIYELPVNKTVSLASSRNCKSGELIINATTAEMGNKEAQTILLLIWPVINP